ncbi:YdcF family protein [Rhizobium sp. G21]|uniref:YdcF family protein n=1 Tax=Rhizobium sp. G21 TaxID=2758439 RepID=UPI001603BB92|nr:YdcF family protein [Rhizobium sp. G21]MBB1250749.1 YdcF family protein [Rhizobium sp. G21]
MILNDAAERVTETAALANRFPTMRVFLSGGWSSDTDKGRVSESSFARQALIGMGVAPERIEMEENSRTTFENAVETRKAITPKPGERWLLLTSASHMPRSVAVFREQGLDFIPYPVDYRTRGLAHPLNRPRSTAVGLTNLDLAAHEWIGLFGYWLSGRTKTLMPTPEPSSSTARLTEAVVSFEHDAGRFECRMGRLLVIDIRVRPGARSLAVR